MSNQVMRFADPEPGFRFVFAQVESLGEVWDVIRAGLSQVRKRSKATWCPEDVYVAIKQGTAALFMAYLDNRYVGFTIVTIITEPFTTEKVMFVWAAYANDPASVPLGVQELETIARKSNVRKIVFYSPRLGWIRRLAPLGFKLKAYAFEKEL